MRMSRYIKKKSEDDFWIRIPREYYISEEEWQREIKENDNLILRSDYEGFDPRPDFANEAILLDNNGKELALLRLIHGVVKIIEEKLNAELIVKVADIADHLKAYLLVNETMEYPRNKVLAARKRMAKRIEQSEKEYQRESFGGNNMWMAIRADKDKVMQYFDLSGEEMEWQKALDKMHACEGIFLYEFRGWTFLAGMDIGELFAPYPKGEKAVESHQVKLLKKWGKDFLDIQLYMHYDRTEYFNAFYRVLHGKLKYGEYETETYSKTYGRMPREIKNLPDNDANTVAMEWSYEPDYLRYQKELENAKAWVVRKNHKKK